MATSSRTDALILIKKERDVAKATQTNSQNAKISAASSSSSPDQDYFSSDVTLINSLLDKATVELQVLFKMRDNHILFRYLDGGQQARKIAEQRNNVVAILQQAKTAIDRVPRIPKQEKMRSNIQSKFTAVIQAILSQLTKSDIETEKALRTSTISGDEDEEDVKAHEYSLGFRDVESERITSTRAIIDQRERDIRQIANDVEELHEIFRDVNTMVVEQGVMLDTIDTNIDMSNTDIGYATEEIKTAKKYAPGISKCLVPVLVAVLILAIVSVTLIVLKMKSGK